MKAQSFQFGDRLADGDDDDGGDGALVIYLLTALARDVWFCEFA